MLFTMFVLQEVLGRKIGISRPGCEDEIVCLKEREEFKYAFGKKLFRSGDEMH